MRHTEFWDRMDVALGPAYSRVWARQQTLGDLGSRTVEEALEQGEPPKRVWKAVAEVLRLPESQR